MQILSGLPSHTVHLAVERQKIRAVKCEEGDGGGARTFVAPAMPLRLLTHEVARREGHRLAVIVFEPKLTVEDGRTRPRCSELTSPTRETWSRTSANRFATRLWSLHPAERPSVPRARRRPLGRHRRRSNFWAFQFPKTGHGRSRNRFQQRSGPARTSASPACS